VLTRGFTGRLGRGVRNALAEAVESGTVARLPYPYQGQVVAALKEAAVARERADLMSFWSGQAAGLVRHTRAAELFATLVRDAA
jgi:nitronate monooxygenase